MRRDGKVVIGGDGQVSMGNTVMKGNARKVRRLYRDQVPRRVLAKQSMHQLDLPEVLALCSTIDKNPQVVVVGIEPQDITTMGIELTPAIAAKVPELAAMVLSELDALGAAYSPKQTLRL